MADKALINLATGMENAERVLVALLVATAALAQGKEVVRWNATRHGISSPAPVVPGMEKLEDWEEHRSGILENLSPVGHLEDGRSTESSLG